MSIKKIAERVGVSCATVSRVLNNPNYKCAKPGLRDKIWNVAMELDYVPNEAARNLKMGAPSKRNDTYYINVLMTRMDADQSDPFFTELLHIIESEIHKHMCILSKVWFRPMFSDDRICRAEKIDQIIRDMYDEEKCDGLIIIGKCNEAALKKLSSKYKNIVSVNRNSTNYEVDEVICDGEKVAAMAVEYLIELGHRNIGYLGECHNEARYKGYLKTILDHEIELNPDYIIETKQTEAEGFEVMERFLHSCDCPTGFYCANDITAIGMLKCLNRYKNRYYMPSIIASDDIEQAQYMTPMLTTVRLPKEEMGKFALFLLLDRMKGGHKNVVRVELEGTLIKRNSCASVEESVWSDYCI